MRAIAFLGAILLIFSLVFVVIPKHVRADNVMEYSIDLNSDSEFKDFWSNWTNGDWHGEKLGVAEFNGEDVYFITSWMGKDEKDGNWHGIAPKNVYIHIANVYSVGVGISKFKDSYIYIENCKYVLIGDGFFNHNYNTGEESWKSGFLKNSVLIVQNFEKLIIRNFTADKPMSSPIVIYGGKNSEVIIEKKFEIDPGNYSFSDGTALKVTNVKNLTFKGANYKICRYGVNMDLRNIENLNLWANLSMNGSYYSYVLGENDKGGIGILAQNVHHLDTQNSHTITIENGDVGVAFLDNGSSSKGLVNAINKSIIIKNCDEDVVYNYGYYSGGTGIGGDLLLGLQAIASVFIAIGWMRIGIMYFSDDPQKKALAKDLTEKAAIGTIMVAMVVFGYPAMLAIVNWLFGG